MPIELTFARKEDTGVLRNLLQLYLHELSVYAPIEIGEDGIYAYEHLDSYFGDAHRWAFLVRVKGKLAGFVMVRRLDTLSTEATYSVAELFVLEPYRRLGIGEEVARSVFEQFQGHWQIGALEENKLARTFWNRVVYRYTGNNYAEARLKGWPGPVYVFKSPAPRPEGVAETAVSTARVVGLVEG